MPVRQVGYLVGIVVTIAVASHFAFQPSRAGSPAFFLWMAIPTVALAILGCVRAWQDGVLRQWFRVKAGDFTIAFLAAALLFGGSFSVSKSLKLPQILWLARLYDQVGDAAALRKQVAWVVIALVVVGVAEELVWRGLVVALLEERARGEGRLAARMGLGRGALCRRARPDDLGAEGHQRRTEPHRRRRRALCRSRVGIHGAQVRAPRSRYDLARAVRLDRAHDVPALGTKRLTP
jgi:hypothetical protein